jgi:AcrR family transcriptional regulator
MKVKESETEKIILNAAKDVFFRKGYDGARMQEIADVAGINKALLHYYFRSKDKLFEAIFEEAFKKLIPKIVESMTSEMNFEEKIKKFINNYIDTLIEVPQIPIFILNELNRNPDRIIGVLKKAGLKPEVIVEGLQRDIENGVIRAVNPKHLIVNIVSLCIFPFAAKPIIQKLFLKDDNPKLFYEFLKERKSEVSNFIINSLIVKP